MTRTTAQIRSYRPALKIRDALAYARQDMDTLADEILVTEGIRHSYQSNHIF